MFSLDNFELDFDDDFSTNVFSNGFGSATDNAAQKENKCSDKSTSECEINGSSKQFTKPTPTESTSSTSLHDFLDFPFLKEFGDTSLKRPCEQDERPQKKRSSFPGLIQRKFPGPAGLLPDKPLQEISHLSDSTEEQNNRETESEGEKTMVFSQGSGSIFSGSGYQKLVSDFNLNESKNPLNKYTLSWVKKTALNKGLHGRKIPFLGLVIHTVNHTMSDPVLVLRDPTGEILGSLHREVWADLGGKLRGGNALALRQVGVLVTGGIRRQIYLNVTMNNILAVYSFMENDEQVETTTVNKVSKLELVQSFEQWLVQPPRNSPAKKPSNQPLFSTVNDVKSSAKNKEEIRNLKNKLQSFVQQSKQKKAKIEERNREDVHTDLGIVLRESDFSEEMDVPQADNPPKMGSSQSAGELSFQGGNSTQELSQEENLIFEEVLSGINFDEF